MVRRGEIIITIMLNALKTKLNNMRFYSEGEKSEMAVEPLLT